MKFPLSKAMNPYQKRHAAAKDLGFYRWQLRKGLTKLYAWAIPNEEALAEIRKHAPIIEIGAGKGYWASLLDVDILCYDSQANNPGHNNYVDLGENYHTVTQGGIEMVSEHPERTLFLCWPPYDTSMAAECLAAYTGDTLVYVGEGDGGCNGDNSFWIAIDEEWEEDCYVRIPRWSGINDSLTIYRRKS